MLYWVDMTNDKALGCRSEVLSHRKCVRRCSGSRWTVGWSLSELATLGGRAARPIEDISTGESTPQAVAVDPDGEQAGERLLRQVASLDVSQWI